MADGPINQSSQGSATERRLRHVTKLRGEMETLRRERQDEE